VFYYFRALEHKTERKLRGANVLRRVTVQRKRKLAKTKKTTYELVQMMPVQKAQDLKTPICVDQADVCSPFQSSKSSSRISTFSSDNFCCNGVINSNDPEGDIISLKVSSEDSEREGEKDGEGNKAESLVTESKQRKSSEYAPCSCLVVSAAGKG